MFTSHLLRFLTFIVVIHQMQMAGSQVLIKMDGKKGNKGKGKLILISGGKCGSPTLIKGGGGKKGGGETILVGGQNGDCDKPKVHVVRQFVPVPYYIPKPVYKYILRHHYVPVRHVVVKPVPVPVPIKVKEHKSYKKSSSYKGEGSSGYETVGYHQGSDSGYDSGMDENSYSGSNVYGKYAAMPHGHTNSGYHSGNYFGLPSSSKSPPHTSGDSANTASPYASSVTLTAGNPKESASSMGSASSPVAAGSPTGGGYQIAPVYQGPNGQLYSNGQLVSKDYFNSNGVQTAFPSATSKSSMSGVPYGSKIPLLTPGGQQSQMNRASLRTNMAKGVLNDYGAQIEEAKKYLTGLTKREDPSGLDSGESNSSSAPSSSSEEDSRESKGAGRM